MTHPPEKSPFAIKNVRLFIAFRIFFNSRFYYPIFTILFLDFGLTLTQFALLNSIWAATIVLLEVPSGALADIIGRKNLLVFAGAVMVVEMGLLCVVPRGNPNLLFAIFIMNRVLSGAAEAAASGADEAIAYDALKAEGNEADWGRVLELQMRFQSIGFMVAMSLGAAVYDPALMERIFGMLGVDLTFTRETTLRLPIYLTLIMAILALVTTLRMKEVWINSEKDVCDEGEGCGNSVVNAFRLTFQAGGWIFKTPFAMVVIATGLLFDSIIRMVITMNSQYYRLISLPEASFGLIGSGLALLGIFIPRLARKMTQNQTPTFNLGVVVLMTLSGLAGITLFLPIAGLIPIIILIGNMYLLGFFISHYLNRITHSDQRATVLSFKGLAYNLAYGLIGVLYAVLLAFLRSDMAQTQPDVTGVALKNTVFMQSIGYFPWFFISMLLILTVFAWRKLKDSDVHRKIG
jgi:MFS family permease